MSAFSLPVGTVLIYAGKLNNSALEALGWRLCDGAKINPADNQALFNMLGTSNGGDGITDFYLPDLRGRFIRGTDPNGTRDPDANERVSAQTGGATGKNVGSLQYSATGAPKNEFEASVPHMPDSDHNAYSGTNADMLKAGGNQKLYADIGGDDESRPRNIYVQFIIKISQNAIPPVGTIIIYPGDTLRSILSPLQFIHFLPCDGSPQSISKNYYPDLERAIGTSYGGDDVNYHLPDYRGYFLRGVDGGSQHDPDASTRDAPSKSGGNSGDNVGSIQDFATKNPDTKFYIKVPLGTDEKTSDHCDGHKNSNYNSDSTNVNCTNTGGDSETRPININVNYYILVSKVTSDDDAIPVGSVVMLPGKGKMATGNWLVCNGASLPNSPPQYSELYGGIGIANGGTTSNFNIPDYQGVFLRGTDAGANIDHDSHQRIAAKSGGNRGDKVGSLQYYATAQPHTPIKVAIPHLPSKVHSNACAIWCSSVANWNSDSTNYTVSGGDNESRPVNLNVDYYIRYA